jgi:tetratricopeptide (TPR) repeat protein
MGSKIAKIDQQTQTGEDAEYTSLFASYSKLYQAARKEYFRGDFEVALNLFYRALLLAQDLFVPNESRICLIYCDLLGTYRKIGTRKEEISELMRKIERIIKQFPDDIYCFRYYFVLGSGHHAEKIKSKEREMLNKSYDLVNKMWDQMDRTLLEYSLDTLSFIADELRISGKCDDAINILKKVLQMSNDVLYRSWSFLELMRIYQCLGKMDLVLEYLEKAKIFGRDVLTATSFPYRMTRVLLALAIKCQNMGKSDEAIEFCRFRVEIMKNAFPEKPDHPRIKEMITDLESYQSRVAKEPLTQL